MTFRTAAEKSSPDWKEAFAVSSEHSTDPPPPPPPPQHVQADLISGRCAVPIRSCSTSLNGSTSCVYPEVIKRG